MKPFIINAFWDAEANVWVATSEDVPGWVAEAENLDSLVSAPEDRISELLEANGHPLGDEIPFQVNSQLLAVAHRLVA